MTDILIPLATTSLTRRAEAARARAAELRREAVRHLECGDYERHLLALRRAGDAQEEARKLEKQRDGVERLRAETAQAIAVLLERCGS